jgi:hypothetical protein
VARVCVVAAVSAVTFVVLVTAVHVGAAVSAVTFVVLVTGMHVVSGVGIMVRVTGVAGMAQLVAALVGDISALVLRRVAFTRVAVMSVIHHRYG